LDLIFPRRGDHKLRCLGYSLAIPRGEATAARAAGERLPDSTAAFSHLLE